MSNVALFNPGQLPAFARSAELSDIAKALTGGGAVASGKRISIKGGVFRLIAGGKEVSAIEERYLDVVIVKAAPKVARTFYMSSYNPDSPSGPDCWSADGDKPDPKAASIQHPTCQGCPQNVAGSGQGQSRACRYQQRLAVVLAEDIEGDVMQLALPATSIFGKEEGENRPLQAYARWLVAQGVDPSMVVTRLKFDTKSEAPKLFFKAMRWLTNEEFVQAQSQGQTKEAGNAVTLNVAAQDGVRSAAVPPLALSGNKPKAKPQPEPEVEEDEAPPPPPKAKKAAKAAVEEDDSEPVVKKAAEKPSAVPAKKSLAAVVADWDDE